MSIIFPPEWHEQAFVQLTWPHTQTDFSAKYYETLVCFTHIAREISTRQHLCVVCNDIEQVKKELAAVMNENITLVHAPTNDVWARDHAAITIFRDNQPVLYDFAFNGWGNKFSAEKDTRITQTLVKQGVFSHLQYEDMNHFVFEGGSIESDGQGVLLTTEACLLEAHRNPQLSKQEIETFLLTHFGAHAVLWLSHGYLQGDDTDSHIDTLARFISPTSIMYVQCLDKDDEHWNALHHMELELQAFRRVDGKPYNLIPLPMTPAIYDENNERLPATYANFLIINSAVLVPIYRCNTDKVALEIFAKHFPNHDIVPIDCSVLITQHGSLHCVTMQYPKGVSINR